MVRIVHPRQQSEPADGLVDAATHRSTTTGRSGDVTRALGGARRRGQVQELGGRGSLRQRDVRIHELALHQDQLLADDGGQHTGQGTPGPLEIARRLQEQQVPQPAAARSRAPHRGVLARPARLAVHPAEAGARHRAREADGVQRDPRVRLQPDDGRVRQLRHTEVLRVRHARAEDHAGAEGARARAAAGVADVRLQGDTEGAGVDPGGAAAGDREGAGRARAQVCQGSEWESRGAEVYRVRRSQRVAGE